MKRDQAPYTLEDTINSVVPRLARVEPRPPRGGGGGGGATIFIQPEEPVGAPTGALWLDTDATCES